MLSKRWSNSELSLLTKYYPQGGYFLCKQKGLCRERDATLKKAQSMGLKVENKGYRKGSSNIKWSATELKVLENNYAHYGKKKMCELLPDRTYGAIYLKARELGLTKDCVSNEDSKWSDVELDILYVNYPKRGVEGCKDAGLQRSSCAIIKKAYSIGIKMNDEDRLSLFTNKVRVVRMNYTAWTDTELGLLKQYFTVEGARGCKDRGLNRDISNIYRKAKQLGYVLEKKGVCKSGSRLDSRAR